MRRGRSPRMSAERGPQVTRGPLPPRAAGLRRPARRCATAAGRSSRPRPRPRPGTCPAGRPGRAGPPSRSRMTSTATNVLVSEPMRYWVSPSGSWPSIMLRAPHHDLARRPGPPLRPATASGPRPGRWRPGAAAPAASPAAVPQIRLQPRVHPNSRGRPAGRASRLRARRAQPVEHGTDAQRPAAVNRCLRRAKPPGCLLRCQPLCRGQQDVGDVGRVTGQDAGVEAAADPAYDELPHRGAGPRLIGARLEVGHRPGEHDLCEDRVGPGERPEGRDRGGQVRARVAGFAQAFKLGAEQVKAVEETLPDQPALVTEQLVHRRVEVPAAPATFRAVNPCTPSAASSASAASRTWSRQRRSSLLRPWHRLQPTRR